MPTTYTIDNEVHYIPVAQPAAMVPAPVMLMPQMFPAPIHFHPAPLPSLPMVPMNQQFMMPANNSPLFFDGSSFTVLRQNLTSLNTEGLLVPPPGYSFVTMDVPSTSVDRSVSAEPALGDSEMLSITSATSTTRSRSSSVVSAVEDETAEPAEAPAKPTNRKFRHRSKQIRILDVHAKLKEEYTAKGLYAGDDEVLRGFDTIRVHVKTYKALNRIECPLNDVEKHPFVKVLKITTPFSMKNRFQKKGFIVYMKLASVDMVPIVQEIFSHYKEDFAKCDVALKKEDKIAQDRAKSMSMRSTSSLKDDQFACDFISTRAYSREGYEFSDWAQNGMGA